MNKTKDLTIREVFEIKNELEFKLFETIKQFERMTGCCVQDLIYSGGEADEQPTRIELITVLNNDYYEDLNKDNEQ